MTTESTGKKLFTKTIPEYKANPLFQKVFKKPFVSVDNWCPSREEMLITPLDKGLNIPLGKIYPSIDLDVYPTFEKFMLTRRAYYSDEMKIHFCRYLNYFEAYYDKNHKLLEVYGIVKMMIDKQECYNLKMLYNDIDQYILHSHELVDAVWMMVEDNYITELQYKPSPHNPGLQYVPNHVKIIYQISVLLLMTLPLLTHFVYMRHRDYPMVRKEKHHFTGTVEQNRKDVLINYTMELFDMIASLFPSIDIYNKLYESCSSIIKTSAYKKDKILWMKQDIRGNNSTESSIKCVTTIMTLMFPKYVFNHNIICFNYKSIEKHIDYSVKKIKYEFNYNPLDATKRVDESNTEIDRYESNLIKKPAYIYLQQKTSYVYTMDNIINTYGPFDNDEIDFYLRELTRNNTALLDKWQKMLIYNLWVKDFGSIDNIKAINRKGYIILILAAKKRLLANHLCLLPYLISSKFERIVERKTLNKKNTDRIINNPLWNTISKIYGDQKILNGIMEDICVILASKFKLIDFHNPGINGREIDAQDEIVCDEMLKYVILCSHA